MSDRVTLRGAFISVHWQAGQRSSLGLWLAVLNGCGLHPWASAEPQTWMNSSWASGDEFSKLIGEPDQFSLAFGLGARLLRADACCNSAPPV